MFREYRLFNILGRPLDFLLLELPDLLYLLLDFFVGVPDSDGGDPMSSSPLRSSEPGTIGGRGKLSKPFLPELDEGADDEDEDPAEEGGLCSLLLRLLLLLLAPPLGWPRCE